MTKKRTNIAVIFPRDSEALFDRTSSRTFGGASVQLYNIAKELKRHEGIEVFSLIPRYGSVDFDDRGDFLLVRTYKEQDAFVYRARKLHIVLKRLRPSIVIQRGLTLGSALLARYCKAKGIEFVFMFAHDIEIEGRYQKTRRKCILFRWLLNSAFLVTQNEDQRASLPEKYRRDSHICKKGIPVRALTENVKEYDAVWVARCANWKEPEAFLDLASSLPGRRFLMVAPPVTGQDGSFQRIRNKASGIENLRFVDFMKNENIFEVLSKSRTVVLTSRREGDWPMTVLEACSCGVPVLSLHLDDELLMKKYRGGIFCEGRPDLMTRYLAEILDDPQKLKEYSGNAYRYVRENHDLEKNVSGLLRALLERTPDTNITVPPETTIRPQ